MNTGYPDWLKKLSLLLPAIIILLGVALRLYAYIDNRCLWTDEVDVALNVFERGYAALAQPLDYGQYAPPLFLWLLKLLTSIFGFGEMAYRLYPLIAGVAALFLFYAILKRNLSSSAYWYPLLLLATGIVFLRYSTEVKQYMSDAMVTLLLVWLVLRTDILKSKTLTFAAIWTIAGSLAIWSSMPSVFVLAGVGCYYAATSIQQRQYNKLWPLMAVSGIWLLQFLYYYYTILNKQIHSDFLVNFHDRFFLFALPSSAEQWTHNKDVLSDILHAAFGTGNFVLIFSTCLLLIGATVLIAKRKAIAWLYILPVALMLVAAAMNQYSLIPRLTIFAMPLLLLLAGFGLELFFKLRSTFIRVAVWTLTLTMVVINNPLQILSKPIGEEKMTDALNYIIGQNISANGLYVYIGAKNSFRYYTTIHPNKDRWATLADGHILPPAIDDESIFERMPDKVALLYTISFDNYAIKHRFQERLLQVDSFTDIQCKAYIFKQPTVAPTQ